MPDIDQSIQDFYRVAQDRDFTRDFQFRVLDVSDRGSPVLTQEDLVYATAASLPARAITNVPIPYMGLSFNLPGAATYPGSEGYALTFRADGQHQLRTVFENWSRDIFDDQTSTGEFRLHSNSTISLAQLNQNLDVARIYKLIGVYPVNVGDMAFDMTGGGNIVNFTATLAYQYWTRSILPIA